MKNITCCTGVYFSKGLCKTHYHQRWYKKRHPSAYPSDLERFWRFVNKTETCWLWTGGMLGKGYGQFKVSSKHVLAHRFAYEAFIGAVPIGLQLDHLCRVKRCVNPQHLEPVTCKENIRRGVLARKVIF